MTEVSDTTVDTSGTPPEREPAAATDTAAAVAAPVGQASASVALRPAPPLGLVVAVQLCALMAAVIDLFASTALDAAPRALTLWVRTAAHLYDVGYWLALGSGAALVVAGWQRFGWKRRGAGYLPLAVVSLAVGALVLPADLDGFAFRLLGASDWIGLLLSLIVASGVVAAAWIGRLFGRWRPQLGGFAAALLLLSNHMILVNDYPAAHLYLAWAGAALGSAALAHLPRPPWLNPWRLRLALALAAMAALASIAIPPSNAALLHLLRVEGSVLAPYLTRWRASEAAREVDIPPHWQPWFRERGEADSQPPHRPLLAGNVNVLLITIDSLRADVLASGKHDEALPTLARLRDSGADFTQARAPGSQTVTTLAQMFAGKYYSELYWSPHPDMPPRDMWPHEDDTTRFPDRLRAAGVYAAAYVPAVWLLPAQGIVRGFDLQQFPKPEGRRYAVSAELLPKLRQNMVAHPIGGYFGYSHLLDAHYTVQLQGADLPPFERYLAALTVADAQLGVLIGFLEASGRAKRTVVIVSSDHGEAFGEHDTQYHRLTLYEELLRVPLLIWGPGIAARRIDTPVSLMDLGPTVLDLFGLPTPGETVGQSLVPLLTDSSPEAEAALTRPILAEGRLKKVLYVDDDQKVIVDDRYRTAELYDLKDDPNELNNLLLEDNVARWQRVALLRKYFSARRLRRPGYKVPYRP